MPGLDDVCHQEYFQHQYSILHNAGLVLASESNLTDMYSANIHVNFIKMYMLYTPITIPLYSHSPLYYWTRFLKVAGYKGIPDFMVDPSVARGFQTTL